MPVAVPAGSGFGPVSAGAALVVAAAAGAFVSSARKLARLQTANVAITNNVLLIIFSLVDFSVAPLLDSFFSFFLGPNTNRLLHIGKKDLAVPDLSGFGRFDDCLNRAFGLVIRDNHLDFKLGQEVHGVLTAPVYLGMSFLAAEAFDFGHRHAGNTDVSQSILNLLQFEWLNDRFDFLHFLFGSLGTAHTARPAFVGRGNAVRVLFPIGWRVSLLVNAACFEAFSSRNASIRREI
jgi:hypothetical protein